MQFVESIFHPRMNYKVTETIVTLKYNDRPRWTPNHAVLPTSIFGGLHLKEGKKTPPKCSVYDLGNRHGEKGVLLLNHLLR